ncbi:UNVERIFIED_CONTAM: hypothetical protein K2H54_036183 [Gekko kuhli]
MALGRPAATETDVLGQAEAEALGQLVAGQGQPAATVLGASYGQVSLMERKIRSVDSAKVSAEVIIRKERKQLIEILHKDLGVVLDDLTSQSVITKEEYEMLDKSEEDSKKKTRQLLLLVQDKGEGACQQFLECLEIVFSDSNLALQYPVPAAEPFALAEGVAELQSKTVIPGSTPIGDIPCSVETKEGLWGEASSETATEGPVDLEIIFSLEEMKEDSKNRSPGTMGEMKAKAGEASSSVTNDHDPEQSECYICFIRGFT